MQVFMAGYAVASAVVVARGGRSYPPSAGEPPAICAASSANPAAGTRGTRQRARGHR